MLTVGNAYICWRRVALQVWLDGLVLLVELCQVRNQVLDNIGVRQRVDTRLLLLISRDAACRSLVMTSPWTVFVSFSPTQASQCVHTIDIHRTAPTNTLSATPPERQSRVHLVLDPYQRIQHHRTSLVQIEGVRLHLRLGGRLIGVPAVDVEGLGQRLLVQLRLLDVGRLGGWDRWAGGGCGLGDGGERLALGVLDGCGHAAAEDLGRERKAPGCETECGHSVWWC